MKLLIQRVQQASVEIDSEVVGSIGRGFMVLFGVCENDNTVIADKMLKKLAGLRIFEDENGKMNLALAAVGGEILAVSQFTLLGDARSSRRPSFINAARPETANPMYEQLVADWRGRGIHVECGRFGADMKVSLINDGPVTILLDSHKIL